MAEDFENHRRIFNRSDDLQGAAAVGAVFHGDIEDPFEQPGPAHAGGLSLTLGVIGWAARWHALAERERFDCATWRWAPARHGSGSRVPGNTLETDLGLNDFRNHHRRYVSLSRRAPQ